MEKARASLFVVVAAAIAVLAVFVMRRPAEAVSLPTDTLAVWG